MKYYSYLDFITKALIQITLIYVVYISNLSRELSETNWLNEVNEKALKKKTLNPSEYVKYYMSKYKRSLMAQFLTGILPLKIENGLFKEILDLSSNKLRCLNSQERICEMCTIGEPEDEIHFLSSCTLYMSLYISTFNHFVTLKNSYG